MVCLEFLLGSLNTASMAFMVPFGLGAAIRLLARPHWRKGSLDGNHLWSSGASDDASIRYVLIGRRKKAMTTLLMNSKNSETLNAEYIDEDDNGKGSTEVNQQSCESEVTSIHPLGESSWGLFSEKSAAPWGTRSHVEESSGGYDSQSDKIPDKSSGGYDSQSDKIPDKSDDGSDEDFDDDELELEYLYDELEYQYGSNGSQKDHEMRKKNMFLRSFFEIMDGLSSTQITGQDQRWHCPACHDGPGAIAWYKGLQALMTHAKTKSTSRMRLHREFVELLEEELQRRGLDDKSRWKGIHEPTMNPEIVWPPMVVLFNTLQKNPDTDEFKMILACQELIKRN